MCKEIDSQKLTAITPRCKQEHRPVTIALLSARSENNRHNHVIQISAPLNNKNMNKEHLGVLKSQVLFLFFLMFRKMSSSNVTNVNDTMQVFRNCFNKKHNG